MKAVGRTAGLRLIGLIVVTAAFANGARVMAKPQAGSAAPPVSTERAFINQYCVGCHNQTAKTAGLMLDQMDVAHVNANAEVWEKVVRKLRAGMMPPAGARRPDKATIGTFAGWLEGELDRYAGSKPNPGAPALHRLNRTEYANVIRDLLSLEIDATSLLPADDSSYGFDNIASALGMSPALMERYLSASSKISRLAIGDATIPPSDKIYPAPVDLTQTYHVEGLPFGTRGGMLIRHNFPVDGEYVISVALSQSGLQAANIANTEQLEISLNGERIKLFDLNGPPPDAEAGSSTAPSFQVRTSVKAGTQSIGATFVAKNYAPTEDTLQPYFRSVMPGNVWTTVPHVGTVGVKGPYKTTGVGDTPSRRQVFVCYPENAQKELPCAKEVISKLSRRAFRRPVTDQDMESLMGFYQQGRETGNFDEGIKAALQRILVSPEFIFRFEAEPAKTGEVFRISDVELASRLSFFLWSSAPDDELMTLAVQGKLKDPAVLAKQVRRMLKDQRSKEFVSNFAGQWLYLRNLQSVIPAAEEFPDYDDNLRQAFRQETELLFNSIVREDRNVVDLLTADYTFLNERLAKHYGIPGVYGSQFRRVSLGPDNPRRGLLGQGSVLTVTSLATRTSPVLRGKWILENILGTPPPEPPPNVPPLKENGPRPNDKGTEIIEYPTVRQRMEEHRTNPVCASCHKMMDPIGFSLENFDAVGQWRTRDGGNPVDAAGQLVDGTKINGPADLRNALLGYSDQFVRTVTERLLTYGLGRGVEYYDMPVVRSVVRQAARDNYRFSSLIIGIVESSPFQMKSKTASAVAQK
jgi:hypothetical protein